MKRKIFLGVVCFLLIIGMNACKKGNPYYADYELKYTEYDGTTLQFLENQGSTYDSLLLVLDRVPSVRARLNSAQDTTTFFAMNNSSFSNALDAMNAIRKSSNRSSLYLEDIPQLLLDSLTYHYAFNGNYSTVDLESFVEGKEVRTIDDYRMMMRFKVTSASGVVGGGQQQIILSDMNNSIFQRYWQESTASIVNIRTSNGILHILSPSHNFGFSKLAQNLSN